MKVLHICLSCFYIDGRGYQENELVRQHVNDGHEVLVLASTETHDDKGLLTYRAPGEYLGEDGARVIRLAYSSWLPHKIMRKLRIHPNVYQHIQDFNPEAILFHGACGNEIVTTARYVRDHPQTLFYVDSHEDWNNSARGLVSREILHKRFYRSRLRKALPQVLKVLCISTETMEFVQDVYGVPSQMLEFYPLGGYPIEQAAYETRRKNVRDRLGLTSDIQLYVQSGKQTVRKKLLEALDAFSTLPDLNARLFVAGTLHDDIRAAAETKMQSDPRISYLGWQSSEELTDILCAADIYLQPGTQSVTMQHALCCHCAIMIDDVPAHQVYHKENGWLISDSRPMTGHMSDASQTDVTTMQEKSYTLARDMLDYRVLANRVLQSDPPQSPASELGKQGQPK